MTDAAEIARAVDAVVLAVPGVDQVYLAAPPMTLVVESIAAKRDVHAHVTLFPTRSVRVSIGVRDDADSRAIASSTAAAVRLALVGDWSDARVHVQVRRIEHD